MFEAIGNFFSKLFNWAGTVTVFGISLTFTVSGILEIIIFAVVAFLILRWIRNTRSWALLKGVLILAAAFLFAWLLQLDNIVFLFEKFVPSLFLAAVIIFHPEIRKGLENIGTNVGSKNFISGLFRQKEEISYAGGLDEEKIRFLIEALKFMGRNKVGSLIVVERENRLDEQLKTGIRLDAEISVALLEQIFEKDTPLHDGAVIIRKGRIEAATCYLPLSQNMDISKALGTRHRAGLGISEVADCITLISSEETGKLSITMNGRIETGVDGDFIRDALVANPSVFVPSSVKRTSRRKGGK